ncbi:MAG TPA: DUF370 domain-containing protein [Ruminococcaceae bacterium]|nr:DUF370 domain-containing protein [Oscillospiraceae bacterium]
MYLHIGKDTVVQTDDIVGVFDIDTSSISSTTREYLANAQQSGKIINVTDDLPKSFIVCHERREKKTRVYISQISSTTLLKRCQSNHFTEF